MTDKFDLIIDRIDDLKEAYSKRLDAIDNNLDIHMKRSDELERKNELLEEHFNIRIEKLEEPKKALNYLWKLLLGIGALAGTIYAVIRLINHFGV